MNEKVLTDAGLTIGQAKIYLFLLGNGLSSAKQISAKTGTGRALTYKILKGLASLGLAEERDDIRKISLFGPGHPEKLKKLLEYKQYSAIEAGKQFDSIYGKLASDFNLLLGKPNVQFLEGLSGLKTIYDDILEVNQDIQIISSPINEREEALDLIREQINKQKEQNIKTKAITPVGIQREYATPNDKDEHYLITRKPVPAGKLKIPAQIIMYGDKVAITNFKESIITVLVESKYIAETFRIMFDYIWNH